MADALDKPLRKHTRAELLGGIGSLQALIGLAQGAAANDRNPNRQAQLQDYLARAFDLAMELGATDPPDAGSRTKFANLNQRSTAV